MATVKGNILFVSSRAAHVSEVWVRAKRVRPTSGGVVTTGNDRFPVQSGGSVSLTVLEGPAVLSLISQGRPVDTIPILVGSKSSYSLEDVVSAAELTDSATQRELERLAADIKSLMESSASDRQAAASSARQAASSASAAKTYESNAAGSASRASSSASSASTDASRAEKARSDTSAVMSQTNELMTRAQQAATDAGGSANTAKQSEKSAASSASAAKASEDAAASSETSAKSSADEAKTAQENAAIHAEAAKRSEDSAAKSATDAQSAAGDAQAEREEITKYAWVRDGLEKGVDLNEFTTSGVHRVGTYSVAASLKNLPDEMLAINSGVLEVFNLRGKACVQRWTVNGPADRPNLTYTRHSDTAGEWSPWEKPWEELAWEKPWEKLELERPWEKLEQEKPWEELAWEKDRIPKGANLDEYLTPGIYRVAFYSTASSLENGPTLPAAVDPAVVEVFALSPGQVAQRWTTLGAVDTDNPVMQRTRDNARNWSEWARIDGGDFNEDEIGSPLAQVNATRSHQMADRGLLRLLLRSEEGTPVWGWTAPPGEKLELPTHEGSGQAVHPSVLYFKDGWNGWKYWMAMTPYPKFNESHEDPNILVSNDGVKWRVPDGLTNPIDDAKGRPDPYNSDAHLTMKDNTMVLTWRMVDRPNKGRESFWMVTSQDGVNWSQKTKIWWPELTDRHSSTVAQSLMWLGDRWRLYFISTTVSPNQIVWVESTKEVPTPADWSKPQECTMDFTLPSDRDFWHSEIQHHDGEYWGIVSDANRRTTGVNGVIYLLHSKDGTKWELSPVPLVPQAGDGHDSLYKTGFVLSGAGESMTIDVFYSAYDRQTREWGTWRTTARYAGPPTSSPKGAAAAAKSAEDAAAALADTRVLKTQVDVNAKAAKGYRDDAKRSADDAASSLTLARREVEKAKQVAGGDFLTREEIRGYRHTVKTEAEVKDVESFAQVGDFIEVLETNRTYEVY